MTLSPGLESLQNLISYVIQMFMPSPCLLVALALGFVIAIILRIKSKIDNDHDDDSDLQ